jgi:hypothetical protein
MKAFRNYPGKQLKTRNAPAQPGAIFPVINRFEA